MSPAFCVRSPILFIIYNRPDVTFRTFEAIRSATPQKLYIAADGPRPADSVDRNLCEATRKITEKIDWECTVMTKFNERNLGCKSGVISAINWFFEHEEEGIILEDDCLANHSFFFYCDNLLNYYRTDNRIATITGTNLQMGNLRGESSYYFSRFSNIWGWATWKRFWTKYDPKLARFEQLNIEEELGKIFEDRFLIEAWTEIFNRLRRNEIDTWDYQLQFTAFFENMLCITPNVNLIQNIGFDKNATHTNNPNHTIHANLPTGQLLKITHPVSYLPDDAADYYFLKKEFYLEEKWSQYYKNKTLRRRVKKWLRSLIK